MIAAQAKLVYHLNKYYNEKCQSRKAAISKTIREVCKVVSDVLKEVEVQEPRFISSLNEMENRFEGLEVISPTEFEVVLYLNQMGVFNFVDDGSLPGCAVLKLSDGRKRSMSLWVEFITASGAPSLCRWTAFRNCRLDFPHSLSVSLSFPLCADYVKHFLTRASQPFNLQHAIQMR
uniref:Mab-21-like 1 n=1 Tax=Paramormyrops kingsleyae TaxID=1676925 RepID=A0A3B3R977_9TELE